MTAPDHLTADLIAHVCNHATYLEQCVHRSRTLAVATMGALSVTSASRRRTSGYRMGSLREEFIAYSNRLYQLARLAEEFFPALAQDIKRMELEADRLSNGCHLCEIELKIPSIFPAWPDPNTDLDNLEAIL